MQMKTDYDYKKRIFLAILYKINIKIIKYILLNEQIKRSSKNIFIFLL